MTEPIRVEVPLVNPNEPMAMVVELAVENGDRVEAGDVICALETSKSIEEVPVEHSGYIAGLALKLGAMAEAGDLLCYIAEEADWVPPETEETASEPAVSDDLLVTNPARRAARELNVDLGQFEEGVLITEEEVRRVAGLSGPQPSQESQPIDGRSILVYGGGGHGKTVIELLRAVGAFRPVAVIDDGAEEGSEVFGVPVLGGRETLAEARRRGIGLAVNAVGGITDQMARLRVSELLQQAGFALPALIHPSAVVEASAQVSSGAQIHANSYVGSDAVIHEGVIVNTGAVVSHDCEVGTHANLAPNCILAGHVRVGAQSLLGMGVTTYIGINVGSSVRAGNGAILNADVPDGRRISAGSIWDGGDG